MKRQLLVSLSALTLSFSGAPALAQKITAVNFNSNNSNTQITPFNLVSRSYQGSFSNQGIPSYGALTSSIQSGKITAQDLVESAIASGRLAPETINDREYLHQVQSHLTRVIK